MSQGPAFDHLFRAAVSGRLSRREVLRRAVGLGLAAPAVAALLAACGSSDTTPAATGGASGSGGGAATSAAKPTTAATAAGPGAASPTVVAGKKGGSLKIAMVGEPPTLDIHWGTPTIIGWVTWNIYETLYTWDANYKLIPMLAENDELSSDGLTHKLTIRKHVPFHNGDELKSADVLASLKRWSTKNALGKALFAASDTVTTPDDYTLEFKMKQPYGTFQTSLGFFFQGPAIYPKSVIDAAGDGEVKDFIGTGPYKFVEHQPDRFIRLARFDNYAALPGDANGYGGHKYAYVDEMVWTPVPDEAARVAGLRSGDYHYLESISTDQYDTLKDDSVVAVDVLPPGGWDTFVLNLKSPLMSNQQIRSAFQAALNHGPILEAAYGKDFYRLDPGIMQKETVWWTDSGKELYNVNDPNKAKQLLQQAGYDGTPVRFMTTKEYIEQYNEAAVGQQQLEAAGFKIDLQVYDWATLTTRRTKPDQWDVFTTGISFRPEPTQLAPMQLCSWPGWWCDNDSQGVLSQLQSESDFNKRFALWQQLQGNFYQQVPMILLGDTKSIQARAKKLQGLSMQEQLGPQLWNAWLQ